jgi:hypothetical protein
MNRTLESALRKQVQLPEAMFQKETNELFAQGYLVNALIVFPNISV